MVSAATLTPAQTRRWSADPADRSDGGALQLDGQLALRRRFPPRSDATDWPMSHADVDQVTAELMVRFPGTHPPAAVRRARMVRLALQWLAALPGGTWQQRWLASGVEQHLGRDWVTLPLKHFADRGGATGNGIELLLRGGVQLLIGLDVIRPGMRWLFARRSQRLGTAMARLRDPDGFAAVAEVCRTRFDVTEHAITSIQFRLAAICAAKGGRIDDIAVGDYVEAVEAQEAREVKHITNGTMLITYELLRAMGIFPADTPSTFRVFRKSDRLSVEQMVDRRSIAYQPMRDLLVAYLRERAPALDYTTLVNTEIALSKLFWRDLELHHPGITSLDLPADVAAAWKQRLQYQTNTVGTGTDQTRVTTPRKAFAERLIAVRGFYLDLAQWAAEDPARWAHWVAPCPIRSGELDIAKSHRRRKAAMDQRTRERLPVLPLLVRTVNQRRVDAVELLAAARAATPGTLFTAAGQTMQRTATPHATSERVYAHEPPTGIRRNLIVEENHAFWGWATVEVLRHTGIRLEELLELSHHSLVQYRLPSTGETVPLLQIAPSKTDMERVLLVSPELADVLAAIVARLRDPGTGAIPMTISHDPHERVWREAQPLLFQYRHANEYRAISRQNIGKFLNEALHATGLRDSSGEPLLFSAHDFRRIFVTDAILNGLPPHIAQIICGHRDINTTMGYKAAYPTEAIDAHRAFLSRRRGLRPSEEYRTPTDTEWEEFLGHFERRKVSLGTCARAFSTACIHEHACIRCPLLWPDPAQRVRMVEIRDNLIARIAEAQREGWLGEVEGLRVSLAGAEHKLTQIDDATRRGKPNISASGQSVAVSITTRPVKS